MSIKNVTFVYCLKNHKKQVFSWSFKEKNRTLHPVNGLPGKESHWPNESAQCLYGAQQLKETINSEQ
ncbi:MAG: hypothetical protein ILA04_00875 [Prevotella sp.]|nr:hypothetical protein [Prevotella sp.]